MCSLIGTIAAAAAEPGPAGAQPEPEPEPEPEPVPAAAQPEGFPGTRVILLGTSGGPTPTRERAGISQAVVVRDRAYIVDCGSGVARQLVRAGFGHRRMGLGDVFLTHLHSDHDADYFNFFLLLWSHLQWLVANRGWPIHVYGPGPAGGVAALPPDMSGEPPFPLVNPENPTPGMLDITRYQLQAHAYDLNIRMREANRSDLRDLFVPHEIELPDVGGRGPDRVAPPMEPILVMEDDWVRVTAILVDHAPVFPSFAYRFDTADGAVVISGDTSPSPNLVKLAAGAEVLVHEVVDVDFILSRVRVPPSSRDVPSGIPERLAAMRHHIVHSHTSLQVVGKVAKEAGVRTLVLSHLLPGEGLPDAHWRAGAQADFDGEVIVGRDLIEVPV